VVYPPISADIRQYPTIELWSDAASAYAKATARQASRTGNTKNTKRENHLINAEAQRAQRPAEGRDFLQKGTKVLAYGHQRQGFDRINPAVAGQAGGASVFAMATTRQGKI